MTEREIQDLLRDMRDEPIPADSLARVRAHVDRRRQRRVVSWKILAGLAVAAACMVAGFLILRPGKPVPQTNTVEIAQVIPAATVEFPVPRVPKARRARPRRVKTEPVLIRIETADPDVVILLVN